MLVIRFFLHSEKYHPNQRVYNTQFVYMIRIMNCLDVLSIGTMWQHILRHIRVERFYSHTMHECFIWRSHAQVNDASVSFFRTSFITFAELRKFLQWGVGIALCYSTHMCNTFTSNPMVSLRGWHFFSGITTFFSPLEWYGPGCLLCQWMKYGTFLTFTPAFEPDSFTL